MLLWNEPPTQRIVQRAWELAGEAVRPADGSTIRRWTRSTFDLAQQLESTEDRYEVLRDGAVVATELHVRSPATRWYSQQQALHVYQEAAFAVKITQLQITELAKLDAGIIQEPDDSAIPGGSTIGK